MYRKSISLEKGNLQEQVNLKYEAAHKGDLFAQSGMAFYYAKGIGVDKNLEKAMCWAIEAEKSGSSLANADYVNLMFFYRQENPSGLQKLTPEFCNAAINAQ